ncbi:MAG: diguanylate cyclase [Pseudomonadota bacterium]
MSGHLDERRVAPANQTPPLNERRIATVSGIFSSPDERAAAAVQTIAQLNEQADKLRAELVRLRQSLVEVRADFNIVRAAQLLEANEQLVLAAIRAHTTSETVTSKLSELAHSSQRDTLTGTPNRILMLDRLGKAITTAKRNASPIAVLFLDIDRFKQINDTLGHAVGDAVLQLFARRVESVLRESDTVSRYGGDEFVVLLTEIALLRDVALIARKMLAAIAEPALLGEHVLHLSASLGIAVYPDDGNSAEDLISRADEAMYHSKKKGRGVYTFYKKKNLNDDGVISPEISVPRKPGKDKALAQAEPEFRSHYLRDANEKLIVAALSAQEMEEAANEARRRQITFLAMVAHELRSPLTPIWRATEQLDRLRTTEPELTGLQYTLKRQVTHLSRLVDDLLDGSRVSTGKFRIERNVVEMADILSLAVETYRLVMDTRQQHFKLLLPYDPVIVHGDPVRLAQIFCNLLDNASKFTPQDGEIKLWVKVLDQTTVITVSDNGMGITKDVLPHIFELFVQDTRAPLNGSPGMGIGLAVVRDLVESHGGNVYASSAGKDRGSQFVVMLPIIDQPILDEVFPEPSINQ